MSDVWFEEEITQVGERVRAGVAAGIEEGIPKALAKYQTTLGVVSAVAAGAVTLTVVLLVLQYVRAGKCCRVGR